MIEFSKEHSKSWLELMTAYQEYQTKLFHWVKENDATKHHDLYMELHTPIIERDMHKRLLVINFLKSTDMWDKQAILLVYQELTEIALREEEEIAAYARMTLKKIKCQAEQINIAHKVFALAASEEKQENPDYLVFHNGCILLHDLGCQEPLKRFIAKYKNFIYLASGLDEADLKELIKSTS